MKCHAAGPPGDFLFTAMISCAIVIFALPLGLILAYLCESVMYLNPDWNAYCCFYYCQRDDPDPVEAASEPLLNIKLEEEFVFDTPEEEALHILDKVKTVMSDKELLDTSHKHAETTKEKQIKQVKKLLGLFADKVKPKAFVKAAVRSVSFKEDAEDDVEIILDENGNIVNHNDSETQHESFSEKGRRKKRHQVKQIIKQLEVAQVGADDITDQFEVLKNVGLNDDQLDMCLLRAFVAEMFFEDAGDAADALAPDNLNLDMVDPFLWIFAWVVVTGIWFFCLYWALVWGIVNGEDILIIWLIEFGTAILQDIFFFIPFVILLMNASGIFFLQIID